MRNGDVPHRELDLDTELQLATTRSPEQGLLSPPLVRSVITRADNMKELANTYKDDDKYFYLRFGANPTVRSAESLVANLERAEAAVLFPTGMAAITSIFFAARAEGIRRVVCQNQVFDQTVKLLKLLTEWEVFTSLELIDPRKDDELKAALEGEPCVLYLESPSNPMIRVIDIRSVVSLFRSLQPDGWIGLDSTFAPPVIQRPVELGADFSVHSCTKYLFGHNDRMGGVVSTSQRIATVIGEIRLLMGAVCDADGAWMLARSLKTLGIRLERVGNSAAVVATFLAEHPKIATLRYAGLGNGGYAPVSDGQMSNGGGMISFQIRGGVQAARQFCNALRVVTIASSLGGTATTVEMPADLDWVDQPTEEDEAADVPRDLIRLSVGLESPQDIVEDIKAALDKA